MAKGGTTKPAVVLRAVDGAIEEAIKRVALSVHHELVIATPVDTGHARANWVPSIGAPHVGIAAPGAASVGVAALASYKASMGRVFIANHVPYIGALNRGHSRQAPPGFIEAAVAAGVAAANKSPLSAASALSGGTSRRRR